MSRIAKAAIAIANGLEVKVDGQHINLKGGKGNLSLELHESVKVFTEDNEIRVTPAEEGDKKAWAMAGTMRSLINNMAHGVTNGWEKKLSLVGVGYRAQVKGNALDLSLGFSHPVEYPIPEGITIQTPSNTEIVVAGVDKQRVGQVAAEIRAYRPPEPYKGKGVRYTGEHIIRKEAKKK